MLNLEAVRALPGVEGDQYEVDPETGCWNWLKAKTKAGYAMGYRYRAFWEAAYDTTMPEGWHMHHKCHNVGCVNPEHLMAISPDDHFVYHRLLRRGRTIEDIRRIYELGRKHGVSARKVAEEYGCHWWTVYYLWKGENWASILGYPGPVEKEPGECIVCGGPVVGRRHKQYCSTSCKTKKRWRDKTPEERAAMAAKQREYRARAKQKAA